MDVIDRYNTIINAIEDMIANHPEIDNQVILQKAFTKAKYIGEANSRSIRNIFLFVTERTADNYISERRMMQAYKHLISTERWDCERAYSIAKLDNQKSFIRKFKSTFNMLPREAYKKKDMAYFKEPLYWANLDSEGKDYCMQNGFSFADHTKFGIPMNKYVFIQRAYDRQTYFGLNDLEAEFAFKLSEEKGYTIDDTFEYVYAYVWKYIETTEENDDFVVDFDKRDRYLARDLGNRYVQYMYFTLEYDFSMIHDILGYLKIDFDKGNHITNERIKKLHDRVYIDRKVAEEIMSKSMSEVAEDMYMSALADMYYEESIDSRDNLMSNLDYDYDMDDPDIIDELFLGDTAEERYQSIVDDYDLDNIEDYERCCEEAEAESNSPIKSKRILPEQYDDLFDKGIVID